jgi:hypothetical protein
MHHNCQYLVNHPRQSKSSLPAVYFSLGIDLPVQSVYPDPYAFNPDRFTKDGLLNSDVKDPSNIVFGFGRRWDISFEDYRNSVAYVFSGSVQEWPLPLLLSGWQ